MMLRALSTSVRLVLPGCLPLLDHVLLRSMADTRPRPGLDEAAFPENQVAVHQLVEGRLLARVFAVAKPFFDELAGLLVRDLPGPLAVDERLVAERDR